MSWSQSFTALCFVFTSGLVLMGWESNTTALNTWALLLAVWALYVSWKKVDKKCCQSDNGNKPVIDVQKRKPGRPRKQK